LHHIADRLTEADNQKETSNGYAAGLIMGYYSIITLLKHEAFVFCIDQKKLGLADIKPDVDLLGLGRHPGIGFEEDNWAIDVMNEEKIRGYLNDSITLLKEQAKEALLHNYLPQRWGCPTPDREHFLGSARASLASVVSVSVVNILLAGIYPTKPSSGVKKAS
jgi:hypothetical protein